MKDGYAAFLVKNGYALIANEDNIKAHNRFLEKEQEKEQEHIKECENISLELSKVTLEFKLKAGKDERVFGTISTKAIADELKKKGFNIDKKMVNLKDAISSLGMHNVEIELHKKVKANLKVKVSKE